MGFADDIAKFCERAKVKTSDAVRLTAIGMIGELTMRSPVGNPELWESNERAGVGRSMRDLYQEEAAAYNAANPGKRRWGTSRATIEKTFPLVAGKGYVGGRFRANWQTGLVQKNDDTSAQERGGSTQSVERCVSALNSWKPGQDIYLTNSLAYAKRIEYGWSSQAPGGVVRLTVQNFEQHFKKAVEATK